MNAFLHRSSRADADRHRLSWVVRPADMTTPVRLFLSLRAAGHHTCLLESVEGPARLARYSFVGVDPVARFRGFPGKSWLESGETKETLLGSSHEALREVIRGFAAPKPPPGLPPFCGGWIGWFAYEWACTLEPRVPRVEPDTWRVPEATFDLYRDLVAFDHAAQQLIVIGACPAGASDFDEAMERIERLTESFDSPSIGPLTGAGLRILDPEPRPRTTQADFEAGVARLQDAIRQGEIFQAVLSQRFEQRCEGDLFTLYRVLRLTNPAPHMFFFETDGSTLVGSSPERLISVRDGRIQVVPIAGTRPRHEDPDEDERLGLELAADPKERAEHDMLVDLARNDIGRVARVGTVAVKEHATLERFQRVQHLVSRVECDLASGRDALDALAACFPAGTVSGAPKVRAMELLAELEPTTRGPYGGAFGYVDCSGNLDMCITIRTLAVRKGTIHVQAGAGVVFDSVPEREHQETLDKAQALFEAVRMADSPAFRPASHPAGVTEEAAR
ncbi:MAG: chorismate-binding protein [Planctomycetota bacterium]|nr:chorismate-binding protein [Planctomycetota bacterium]